MKHYTTIEQSKKLIELGLNPESADMIWNVFVDGSVRILPKDDWDICNTAKIIPCWSVGALLEVMPEVFGNSSLMLVINNGYEVRERSSISTNTYKTPIEAVYNMVIWLLENNYIKKGE